MPIIYLTGVVLIIFIVVALAYHSATTGYKQTIDTLLLEKAHLEVDKAQLQEDAALLSRQLQSVQEEVDRLQEQLTKRQAAEKAEDEKAEQALTVVDLLLKNGSVMPEGVKKAEKFKADTKSPYSVEEVLVLLNLASSGDVLAAKRRLAKG